jgi:hypothetical protein
MEPVSEVERWDGEPEEPALPAIRQPPGGAIDRNRSRGLDFTPEELQARRSNRRWMVGLAVGGIAILAGALAATAIANGNQPSGPRQTAPPGYQTVYNDYFSFVVPKTWTNNGSFTDGAGDVENSGPTGFAAQHIDFLRTPPTLGQTPPAAFQSLGTAHPAPFTLSGGHPVQVKGASTAFAYTATRPGGFTGSVIDAYDYRAAVELWLLVSGPADVTATVLNSLET